jgi:lipopolysaccharide/colanic/teichoic acid biosynthesis glycosyltransferase
VTASSIPVAIKAKRVVDLLVSALLLALLALPFAILCLAICLESPGAPFYRQQRLGWKKQIFTIYKLRTMRRTAGAPVYSAAADVVPFLHVAKSDPRITRLGRWLRRYSVDELPQLLNVFLGDMSLVGPRPFDLRDFEQGPFPHPLYAAWVDNRHLTRPGITGLWQIKGRNDTSFGKLIKLDLFYVSRWTPLLECKILCGTLGAVWRAEGAY